MKKIITKKNSKELSYLRDKIVVWAEEYLKKKITSLDRLHEYIEKEDALLSLANEIKPFQKI